MDPFISPGTERRIQPQKLTCNDHRAVLTANLKKANLESTGIGAAACSRHGFFIPHTCVDFQNGEGCVGAI